MMHSTSLSSSSSTPTGSNHDSYGCPPISTLRRHSRPSNIDLPHADDHPNLPLAHPAIYSAPIFYMKPGNHPSAYINQSSTAPYTAAFHSQAQHLPSPSHSLLPPAHHHVHLYPQTQTLDPYSQLHDTPHTFPLQASQNHPQQYFHFPPTQPPGTVSNTSQPSTPNQHSRLREPIAWSNPALNPFMIKRMNETGAVMRIVDDDDDDDEDDDPSASIDALVGDDESSSSDLLHDQVNKGVRSSNTAAITSAGAISPSPHTYLRGTSHMLTTPPNPLASDDHPDNQLAGGQSFAKAFSPIPSAGFELSSTSNNAGRGGMSSFTFESQPIERASQAHDDNNREHLAKPRAVNNIDARPTMMQDDSSNQSSSNGSSHKTSSRVLSQILQSSEHSRLPSSSPVGADIKPPSMNSHRTKTHSMSTQQQENKHFCSHPECDKVFANKSALAKHKLTHSQDRKHKCSKCNKGFKRLDHLHGHMLTHQEEKPHKCRVPNCNRTYCDARSLKRHIENTHQNVLAAIHEGGHEEWKQFLPETACVTTKDSTNSNDFSIDSVDSTSPRSFNDQDSSRAASGSRGRPTYTFDEAKCVECHICKRTFKNGAALNGHMRLHGGFNEKQPSPSSVDPEKKKKRPGATSTKRKANHSSTASVSNGANQQFIAVKGEKQDVLIPTAPFGELRHQPGIHPLLSSSPHQFPDRSSSTPRTHSTPSPSMVRSATPAVSGYNIKAAANLQSASQLYAQHNPGHSTDPEGTRLNFPNEFRRFDPNENARLLPNYIKMSGASPKSLYIQPSPNHDPLRHRQPSPNLSQLFPLSPSQRDVVQRLYDATSGRAARDQHPSPPSFPSLVLSSIITTPMASTYSSANTHHQSSASSSSRQERAKDPTHLQEMQPSPATHSTSSSCSSLSSDVSPKKSSADETNPKLAEDKKLAVASDKDPLAAKPISGFLIGTPSSTGASSSSSSSSHQHFTYENIEPQKKVEPTASPFLWPSQFRRQLSLNPSNKVYQPVPTTPYTPPPMLSPFRKGPGLYYRVFSHPGSGMESHVTPTTPILAFSPMVEDSSDPKINVGADYQASIPKLRPNQNYDDGRAMEDELLFSASELSADNEQALEQYEQLNRTNPFLFSSRQAPRTYPLELVYMLLHEYRGDLQQTFSVLLDGKATDIKTCRLLHRYRFPECDQWTPEEIAKFTKALQHSEKNFELVSRTVRTKTVRQCIEFYYMPKIQLSGGGVTRKGTSSIITRGKHSQLLRSKKQQQKRAQFDDDTSSSSFNENRLDEDSVTTNGDTFLTSHFSCNVEECSQTFTSERAWRAHCKDHRRANHSPIPMISAKRTRRTDRD